MNPTFRNEVYDILETLVTVGAFDSEYFDNEKFWETASMDWMVSPIPSKETIRFVFESLTAYEGKVRGTFGKKLDKCLDDFMCEFTPEDVD